MAWLARGRKKTAAPPAKDRRYKNACLFGTICPARGVGAGPVMPFANTGAMQKHCGEISRPVSSGAHAVLRMD